MTIEKDLQTLPIMESFYTLQGEGYHQGKAAYFIRLAGCDVGCHWCDVKESWDAGKHKLQTIEEITLKAIEHPSQLIVITGGEPVMYNLSALCDSLILKERYLALETSGAYPISGKWHWICLSPKKNKAPLPEYLSLANELKIIIYNQDDFNWAEKYAALVNNNCKLYLQPEWSKKEKINPLIIDYIKNNPKWQLSIQSHKYVDIP